MMKNPILNINAPSQIAYVVYDLDKTIERMWTVFGMGPWTVNIRDCNATDDASRMTETVYMHKPSQFSFKNASTVVGPNNLNIEIIQPLSGENIYADFLRQHGEGMQHLGWHLVHSHDELVEVTNTLEQNGFPCLQSFKLNWVTVALFDTTKVLNTILEVSFRHPNSKRPDPLYVYPKPIRNDVSL
jgi:methylmalonyl-CoA/ethylmalonyl-CoA epimerase